ncbi:MarR family winged helix-turn-helix transcriptional regulator [Streptosporangium sp. NPDC049376]|uniref:MarR family winged helix-turn-helix transcriptional regulator n=1 Tax=Streptosporangium sp. NPDC049376 TaxID=3366192 RepID=UPI0037B9D2FC
MTSGTTPTAQNRATDGPVMENLQLIGLLTRLVEQRLSQVLGINSTDLSAIEHLITDGPLTAKDLADRLQVSTAASTHIVDRLERAGHVTRQPHTTDRRKVLVVLADTSKARLFEHLAPLLDGVSERVDKLSGAEREVIEHFLAGVVQIYTAAAEGMTSS